MNSNGRVVLSLVSCMALLASSLLIAHRFSSSTQATTSQPHLSDAQSIAAPDQPLINKDHQAKTDTSASSSKSNVTIITLPSPSPHPISASLNQSSTLAYLSHISLLPSPTTSTSSSQPSAAAPKPLASSNDRLAALLSSHSFKLPPHSLRRGVSHLGSAIRLR